MKLRFSDGIEIETGGEFRVIKETDGYYVVGRGVLMAVDSREDGYRQIELMKSERSIK